MTIKRDAIKDLRERFRAAGSVQVTDGERRALSLELQDVVAAVRASGQRELAVHARRALVAPPNEVDVHLNEIVGVMYEEGMTEV